MTIKRKVSLSRDSKKKPPHKNTRPVSFGCYCCCRLNVSFFDDTERLGTTCLLHLRSFLRFYQRSVVARVYLSLTMQNAWVPFLFPTFDPSCTSINNAPTNHTSSRQVRGRAKGLGFCRDMMGCGLRLGVIVGLYNWFMASQAMSNKEGSALL